MKPRSKPPTTEEEQVCRNCAADFKGHFCPQCGQSAKSINRPLRFITEEFLGTLFAFDTRFWRTLISVVVRPGRLVNDMIEGRQQRYMPPFRMYVFVSFFLILLLGFYNKLPQKNNPIVELNTVVNDSLPHAGSRFKTDTLIMPEISGNEANADTSAAGDQKLVEAEDEEVTSAEALFLSALNQPQNLYDTFSRFFSWAMFLLMPLYGFFLWVFFRKSYRYYVPHFFLSIVQHILVSLVMIFIVLIKLIFPEKAVNPEEYLMWFIPLYVLMGAMQLYRHKWYSVVWRMAIIMGFYFFIVLISMSVVFYYSMVQVSAAV